MSDPAAFIRSVLADHPSDPTINLHITSVTSSATVENTINSNANSGNNTLATGGTGTLATGDAYSIVSILNRVNLIMIDSVIHIVTINIFGTLNGDIILPVPLSSGTGSPCNACTTSTNVSNTATVDTNVSSTANTGGNTASGAGSIQTGNTQSAVSVNNLVNTTLIGANVFALYINAFGVWNGSFVGYGNVASGSAGYLNISGQSSGTTDCGCTGNVTATQTAMIKNTVHSSANTGNNTLSADSGSIRTGNAISDVSVINLVNTVLYRTTAFFGFINIFGSWHGNVGDAASLAKAEATPTPAPTPVIVRESGGAVNEPGGLLTLTQTNNVGAFVNPGDTVTFFSYAEKSGKRTGL